MNSTAVTLVLVASMAVAFTPFDKGRGGKHDRDGQTSSYGRGFGPHPRAMVNIHSSNLSLPEVPAQGTAVVYDVPQDFWLVATGFKISNTFFELCESYQGELLVKRSRGGVSTQVTIPEDMAGPMGWTFRPGSQVLVRNDTTATSSATGRFSLTGYLVHK